VDEPVVRDLFLGTKGRRDEIAPALRELGVALDP
jgi:hypothetical protein